VDSLFSPGIEVAEARLAPNASLVGKTLNAVGFRHRFGANVLATRLDSKERRWGFQDEILKPGMVLLLQGKQERLEAIKKETDFDHFQQVSQSTLENVYRLQERLLVMEVPDDSAFAGKTLGESRIGDALGMRVLSIIREETVHPMPQPEDALLGGDQLIIQGRLGSLEILRGLEGLKLVEGTTSTQLPELESEEVGLVEVMLSPRTTVSGKTLRELRFRDKYDLTALAILREGQAMRSELRDVPLRFGDALLLHGQRRKFSLLGQDPDFLVLTEAAQHPPRSEKMKLAICIFAAVLLPVVLGLLPIHIAVVMGSACMVIAGCLTMEEAYRFIEWKAVFLIAGMLPLGVALDKTGAARFLADGVVALVGPFGPLAVLGGLLGLTFLATCFVPTAALVVLMAPIALKTSADMAIAPHALMMAVAMAASASFITPVSHPANVLVMGPGGYRFVDYLKVGLPLTLVVFLVLMFVIPFFWPLM
jgi:di/tricarboxylate transporter